ncbi:Acetyltransferase involved in cellulose biosynthesis, CelD/BcsL family [Pseudovibrio denitrificans]|uniref:Acetyltransferase involved in cellulose biosynthesis, CelD/BcsL family n=1 Tax=Pseudovibrio denitrificans TaxID=258256 RepID=A0A1I7AIR8_9HYPH|nr:GNAT family N-acetyltransferase [Pseudovibrio denitrificans]SFT74826.1 Acetyltransferase involved in cellulose biosynthesis, CelD/BcsL family [Pseudovibrio denitrificans]
MKQDSSTIKLLIPGKDEAADHLWQDLSKNALEPNPFFSSSFVTAFNTHKANHSIKLLLALDPSGTKALAALPIMMVRRGLLFKLPSALAGDYGPLGTLLLSEDATPAILNNLLEAACNLSPAKTLLLPFQGTEGATYKQLQSTLSTHGWQQQASTQEARAFQPAGPEGQAAFNALKKRSSWKGVFKNQRRLEKQGTLSFSILETAEDTQRGLEEFLKLEAEGWKGKQGTALLSREPDAAFTREMVTNSGKSDGIRIGQLHLDDKLIATNILLHEQGRIFGWKTTFDESLAKFSPGQLLIYYSTQKLLEDPFFSGADSLSTPDNQMANKAWTARFSYATLLIGKGPLARLAMWEAETGARIKQALKSRLKKLLGRK